MRLGNSVVKGADRGVWVAIRKLQGVQHGGDYLLRRAIRVFVAAQDDRAAGFACACPRHEFAEGKIGERRKTRSDSRACGKIAEEVSSCSRHRYLAAGLSFVVDSRERCRRSIKR